MVISFNNDIAWRQLVDHGEVVTFRKRRRENPNCETWCNRGRGQTKEFDVKIEEIGKVVPEREPLLPYLKRSGFETIDDWIGAIEELNSGNVESGWLYRVTTPAATETADPTLTEAAQMD
jgi:hypothetical protein